MKVVYICSPLRGNIANNIAKAQQHCLMAIEEGYCPIAPHAFFPLFMDDTKEEEREKGIACAMELLDRSDELWQFGEPSEGMKAEIKYWREHTTKPILCFEEIEDEIIYNED